jgi:hypothetical protein
MQSFCRNPCATHTHMCKQVQSTRNDWLLLFASPPQPPGAWRYCQLHTIEGILLEHLPDDLSSSILQLHLMRMAEIVGTTTPTRCQWAYMRLPQQSLHRRHPNSPFRPSKDMSGTRRQYSGLNILGLDKAKHSMTRLQRPTVHKLALTNISAQDLYQDLMTLHMSGKMSLPQNSHSRAGYTIWPWSRLRSSVPGPGLDAFCPGQTSSLKLMP